MLSVDRTFMILMMMMRVGKVSTCKCNHASIQLILALKSDMPVVRSTDSAPVGFDDAEDPRKLKYQAPVRIDEGEKEAAGNATGTAIELAPDIETDQNWRDKLTQDESDYTRVRLFEDEESEEVHMRTKFLFDDNKAMTPLSQMQATKEMLTEGQKIAYVGLSALVAREMILDMGRGLTPNKNGKKEEAGVVESGRLWMLKTMARLYQHMDLTADGMLLYRYYIVTTLILT
jgi:hypothetical protein